MLFYFNVSSINDLAKRDILLNVVLVKILFLLDFFCKYDFGDLNLLKRPMYGRVANDLSNIIQSNITRLRDCCIEWSPSAPKSLMASDYLLILAALLFSKRHYLSRQE